MVKSPKRYAGFEELFVNYDNEEHMAEKHDDAAERLKKKGIRIKNRFVHMRAG